MPASVRVIEEELGSLVPVLCHLFQLLGCNEPVALRRFVYVTGAELRQRVIGTHLPLRLADDVAPTRP